MHGVYQIQKTFWIIHKPLECIGLGQYDNFWQCKNGMPEWHILPEWQTELAVVQNPAV